MSKDTIIVIMIDFVRCIVNDVSPESFMENPLLEFNGTINRKTGEISKFSIAYFRGLKFKVFEPTLINPNGRLTVEGSLHKYWNNGLYNYNDFGVRDVHNVLCELLLLFGINADKCFIRQLELGINICPKVVSKTVINNCFMHGTNRFGWQSLRNGGQYIQAISDRKIIKIYDKANQYRKKGFFIEDEILRVEVKYKKMQELNKLGIFTIQDLMNYGLSNLVENVLLKEWGKVLIYDDAVFLNHKNRKDYSNPLYWIELANGNYELFKYHRGQVKCQYLNNKRSFDNMIKELIKEKIQALNIKTTEMHTLYNVCN